LNYLRIGKAEDSFASSAKTELRKANVDVLQEFGDNFLDILCRDTVSGHDIRRMLALSVLVELVALDSRGGWMHYMSNQGYLRHIVESVAMENDALAQLLAPLEEANDLRSLYAYEAKMALLSQLASTADGAELLLETGLMLRLSEMSVFSLRPDSSTTSGVNSASMDADSDHPSLSPFDRYQQILFPTLHLCQSIMASLGSKNKSVSAQVNSSWFLINNQSLIK